MSNKHQIEFRLGMLVRGVPVNKITGELSTVLRRYSALGEKCHGRHKELKIVDNREKHSKDYETCVKEAAENNGWWIPVAGEECE